MVPLPFNAATSFFRPVPRCSSADQRSTSLVQHFSSRSLVGTPPSRAHFSVVTPPFRPSAPHLPWYPSRSTLLPPPFSARSVLLLRRSAFYVIGTTLLFPLSVLVHRPPVLATALYAALSRWYLALSAGTQPLTPPLPLFPPHIIRPARHHHVSCFFLSPRRHPRSVHLRTRLCCPRPAHCPPVPLSAVTRFRRHQAGRRAPSVQHAGSHLRPWHSLPPPRVLPSLQSPTSRSDFRSASPSLSHQPALCLRLPPASVPLDLPTASLVPVEAASAPDTPSPARCTPSHATHSRRAVARPIFLCTEPTRRWMDTCPATPTPSSSFSLPVPCPHSPPFSLVLRVHDPERPISADAIEFRKDFNVVRAALVPVPLRAVAVVGHGRGASLTCTPPARLQAHRVFSGGTSFPAGTLPLSFPLPSPYSLLTHPTGSTKEHTGPMWPPRTTRHRACVYSNNDNALHKSPETLGTPPYNAKRQHLTARSPFAALGVGSPKRVIVHNSPPAPSSPPTGTPSAHRSLLLA
ncbi:hypothetical protein C8F04DRAFT_1267275 [Mycena alexandri]|uniref:Uncharacterized protein n=1 Tax=Mycena alexandri TaxID=1745969 RepID=A0AAD6SGF6_9AGAR|nr:hypothetical protein C8F04DRAFT_1267275 [Mycena alexandri]